MSNNEKWYLDGQEPSLRMWIFTQMSMGAIYAALVFFGAIAFVLVLVAISRLLPDDPYAALETGKAMLSALA